MLAEERFALILEQLNEKRTVTVQQLCEALHTSESTIRRDLTELDRQGRLTKVHGGATLPDSRFLADEPTMEAKETLTVAEKRSIAAAAAALITAEDFVFIDAGTTTKGNGRLRTWLTCSLSDTKTCHTSLQGRTCITYCSRL